MGQGWRIPPSQEAGREVGYWGGALSSYLQGICNTRAMQQSPTWTRDQNQHVQNTSTSPQDTVLRTIAVFMSHITSTVQLRPSLECEMTAVTAQLSDKCRCSCCDNKCSPVTQQDTLTFPARTFIFSEAEDQHTQADKSDYIYRLLCSIYSKRSHKMLRWDSKKSSFSTQHGWNLWGCNRNIQTLTRSH